MNLLSSAQQSPLRLLFLLRFRLQDSGRPPLAPDAGKEALCSFFPVGQIGRHENKMFEAKRNWRPDLQVSASMARDIARTGIRVALLSCVEILSIEPILYCEGSSAFWMVRCCYIKVGTPPAAGLRLFGLGAGRWLQPHAVGNRSGVP